MKQDERVTDPPSYLRSPIFVIGKNSKGNWVVQERSRMRGGLFVDRARALKFVKSECGPDPHAILWVSGLLELDLSVASTAASEQRFVETVDRKGRAA